MHNASLPSIVIRALSGVIVNQQVIVGDGSDRNACLGVLDRSLCSRDFGKGAVAGQSARRLRRLRLEGLSYTPNLARVEWLCRPKAFQSDLGGFQPMQVGKHTDNGQPAEGRCDMSS